VNCEGMTVACTSFVDDIEDSLQVPFEARPVHDEKPRFFPVADNGTAPDELARRTVPGVHTIWVRTFGCSHNQSDSEYMMGILQAYGYRHVAVSTSQGRLPMAIRAYI
jgi:hypothetical protein